LSKRYDGPSLACPLTAIPNFLTITFPRYFPYTVLLSHFDLLCSSSRVRSREPDELVLNFNIQDVILLADYNAATELNAVTFSDVIGVEPKEVVRNADLQDILEGSKEVDEKEI
jgi:hypothetical protein